LLKRGDQPELDVFPIFVSDPNAPHAAWRFCGTGFLAADELLLTCWHCVASTTDLPEGKGVYGIVYKTQAVGGTLEFARLDSLSRDECGTDIASALVPLKQRFGLTLGRPPAPGAGIDVWSFGYPLTQTFSTPEAPGLRFTLEPRLLKGYVMRTFFYAQPGLGSTPSYELDMPTPAGLSGAPLVRVDQRRELVGIVYGSHDVAEIDEFESVDPETGATTPEVRRVVSFGLAHFLDILHRVRGVATEHLPLAEWLAARAAKGR